MTNKSRKLKKKLQQQSEQPRLYDIPVFTKEKQTVYTGVLVVLCDYHDNLIFIYSFIYLLRLYSTNSEGEGL